MKRPLCFVCFLFLAIVLLITKFIRPPDELEEGYHAIIGVVTNKQEGEGTLELYLRQVVILDNVISYETALEQYEVKPSEETQTIIAYVTNQGGECPKIGSTVLLEGKLQSFSSATNYGGFDLKKYRKSQGYDGMLANASMIGISNSSGSYKEYLYQIRLWCGSLFDLYLSEKAAGVLKAMILGDKENLDENVQELYEKNGVIHVIAISGLHISLIGMCFYGLLVKSRVPLGIATIMTVVFLYFFLQLTGMTCSGMRALIMFIIYLLAKYYKRTYDMMTSMSIAFVVVMLWNPYAWEQVGMVLSFGAIFAITCFSFVLDGIIIKPLQTPIAIQLITFPIIAGMYYEYPITSVFLNLLIVPTVGVLVGIGIVILLIGSFAPYIASCLGNFITAVLAGYEGICNWFLLLPYQSIPVSWISPLKIVMYYSVLLGAMYLAKKCPKRKGSRVCVILFALVVVFYKPQEELRITMIDVGQGDGIFIQTPTNHTYLIDGGSTSVSKVGEYALIPTLQYYGVRKIDGVFLTHMDHDHISGICELLEIQKNSGDFVIESFFLGTTVNKELAPDLFELIEDCEIEIHYLAYPDTVVDGSVKLNILMPYEGYIADNENENSLVFSLSYGDFDMLFTGDMEGQGEAELLQQIRQQEVVDYEVLKVGHHGSKNATSTELLQEITPEYGLISCGFNNTYGHPSEDVLQRMEAMNMKWYETDLEGAIVVETDGIQYEIFSYCKKN